MAKIALTSVMRAVATCDPRFIGEFCQEIYNCVGVDCSNNRQCLDGENRYCNVFATSSVTCNGRGQCIDLINDFNCDSNPGYTGM